MPTELRALTPRKLPNLSPAQVVSLQDALLGNADAFLTAALTILERGQVSLAQSLAILGLEESGKAIAIHDRRVAIVFAPEGEPFVNAELEGMWSNHQRKLELVHRFLSEEAYWFGVAPPDPEQNAARLGTIKAWSKRRDRGKRRGFYVEISKSGDVMAPTDVANPELLEEVIRHVHQIGWQIRLGEHIEGQLQDEREKGSPPASEGAMELLEEAGLASHDWLRDALHESSPGQPLSNAAYRFNGDESSAPFRNFGKPGYEAETRELKRIAQRPDALPPS